MALEPNNNLLNYDFETYRVSLKKLESVTKEINCVCFDWNNKNGIANFSQIKAFGIHNNLIIDDFFPKNAYFISDDLKVYKVALCEDKFDMNEVTVVFQSTIIIDSTTRRIHPILFLSSPNIACFYDGIKLLNVIKTNNRYSLNRGDVAESWQLLCSTTVVTSSSSDLSLIECRIETVKATEESDVSLKLKEEEEVLHCCFLKIYDTSFDKNVELIWTKFKFCHQSKEISVINTKIWRGSTPPEMVTFTSDFKRLEIVGDHSFRYIPQDLTADNLNKENIKSVASWWQESNEFFSVQYYLTISPEEFTVDIIYPTVVDEDLVILLTVKDKEPLELHRQKFISNIDKTLSKWFIENEMLIIELKKVEVEDLEDIAAKRSKVTFDQYEDVDNCDDVDLALVSFDASSGNCIEEIGISMNEWMFKTRLSADSPFSACIRYNVDGLVWSKTDSSSTWTHKHTLNAFGYVSAAKVDRKFIVCSLPHCEENGIKFAVVSDWKRTLCVFMQQRKMDDDMSVKNRNSGKTIEHSADEFFLSLDKCQDIVGVAANRDSVIVLYKTIDNLSRVTVFNCC